MKIDARTIPHAEQRYPTVGDYWWEGPELGTFSTLHIRVSDMGDPRMEALVIHHEEYEALACAANGVDEPSIAAFDKAFEQAGDDYVKAGVGEMMLMMDMGITLDDYDNACQLAYDSSKASGEALKPAQPIISWPYAVDGQTIDSSDGED
jgi:hypothetical protein